MQLEQISGLLVFVASFFYIHGVVKGKIIPTKATWVVWTALSSLTAISMYAEGVINWQIIGVATCDLGILTLAFIYGRAWMWSGVDISCIAVSAIAVGLWQMSGDPVIALILLLLATIVGFIPMAMALSRDPSIEKPTPWLAMFMSSALLIASITEWSWINLMQPVVYLTTPMIVLVLLWWPRRN